MTAQLRVIGIGQAHAGDDGVGLQVVEALRQLGDPGNECIALSDPSELVEYLQTEIPVVVVDAVLGEPIGTVVELEPEKLDVTASGVSTHGVTVAQAIALARSLGGAFPASLRVVGITIAPPTRFRLGLSPQVAAAVPAAIRQVRPV